MMIEEKKDVFYSYCEKVDDNFSYCSVVIGKLPRINMTLPKINIKDFDELFLAA